MSAQDLLPCPACHTPLPPEATGCPICMRPRSKQEMVRGYTKLRQEKARRRRRPFQALAALIFLFVGGKLALMYGAGLKILAGQTKNAVARWMDDLGDPARYAQRPAPAVVTAPAPAMPDTAAQTIPPLEKYAPPQAPDSNTPPAEISTAATPVKSVAAPKPPAPKPRAPNDWRIAGTVYNLATLAPVPKARITFVREKSKPRTVTTDKNGDYTIDLLREEGWTVQMVAPEYRKGQILELDPPYRVRDADERRAALELVTDGDLAPAPVEWKPAQAEIRQDLIAVPKRWDEEPEN